MKFCLNKRSAADARARKLRKGKDNKERNKVLQKFIEVSEGTPPCFGNRFVFPEDDPFCRVCKKGKSILEIENRVKKYAQFLETNPDLYQENKLFRNKSPEEIAKILLSCPYLSRLRMKKREEIIIDIRKDVRNRFSNDPPELQEIRIQMMIKERQLEFALQDELVRRRRREFIKKLRDK